MPNELERFSSRLIDFHMQFGRPSSGRGRERDRERGGMGVRVCELLKLCTLPRITKSLVKCRKQCEGEQKLKATTKREEAEEDSKQGR